MPYPKGHRAETKKKIVASARRHFNRYGFDGASLSRIMAGAGLTHGVFYTYFKSKSDLYAEVLGCFFTDPEWKNNWEGVEVDLKARDAGRQIVRAYLSRRHFDEKENSCPMVALPSDVARSGSRAKRAFEAVFRGMVGALEQGQRGNNGHKASRAQAIAALCVGGMVVARAMMDESLADQLREDCTRVALELGGWGKEAKIQKAHTA